LVAISLFILGLSVFIIYLYIRFTIRLIITYEFFYTAGKLERVFRGLIVRGVAVTVIIDLIALI